LNEDKGDAIIRVETESDVLGNGVFWEGPTSRISEIRNIPARKLAHLVATDGKSRSAGMWRASVMAAHPGTGSD
jgi:hypothetical protein